MKLIFDFRCLEYFEPGHPESPERVRVAYEFLKEKYEIVKPEIATEKEILKAHAPELLTKVKEKDFYDPDCPRYENIFFYASLAAGAAIKAAKEKAFSLMRPPGHHAGKNYLRGFCYFNSIAIAVKNIDKKTLIIDIDGHHGDGTQDIFLGDEKVTYISLHRSPWYPGTGLKHEKNCLNFPLPAECGDKVYLKTLDKALKLINPENFEIIGISAGFDAYKGDLASLGLSSECYREIGRKIASLNLPVFAVLEGGYNRNIGREIDLLIQGLEE